MFEPVIECGHQVASDTIGLGCCTTADHVRQNDFNVVRGHVLCFGCGFDYWISLFFQGKQHGSIGALAVFLHLFGVAFE
ncbi:hypothetical protein D3C85_1469680 [compost metagenome]